MIVAAIDVGTNTALLLVASVSNGRLVELESHRRFIRLGEGVGKSGFVLDSAIDRLVDALKDFRKILDGHRLDALRVVGTSASRDASNIADVVRRVKTDVGFDYEVIDGHVEARSSFAGAMAALEPQLRTPGRLFVVMDIGGGSTELVVGRYPNAEPASIEFVCSLDVGTVRLTERHVERRPILPEASRLIASEIKRALISSGLPNRKEVILVGAAGTAVTLAQLKNSATTWSELPTDTVKLMKQDVVQLQSILAQATIEETIEMNPELMSGRADVIPVGATILVEVMDFLGVDSVVISPWALRHGLALEMLSNIGGRGTIN